MSHIKAVVHSHMCRYVCLQFLKQISANNCTFSNKPVSDFCYFVISIQLHSFLQFLQLQQFRGLKLRHVFGNHSDLEGCGGGGGYFLGFWLAVVKISQHRLNDLVGQIINDCTTVRWRTENNKASSRGVMNIHWKCALHETIYQRQLYEIGAAMEDFYSGAGTVNL